MLNIFATCSGLTSVIMGNSVAKIGNGAFAGCNNLKSVTISNSVEFIDKRAFYGCSSLNSIILPNVRLIEEYAFRDCNGLTSVTLKRTEDTSIQQGAFNGCKNITDFYCYAENIPYTSTFNGKSDQLFIDSYIEHATLHVQDASIDRYKAHSVWGKFGKIVSLSGAEIETKKCATPTIAYVDQELQFSCTTEGVDFVSEITDDDIKKHHDSKVKLTVTYNISVYATLTGYENSDVATATLCWIETEPTSEDLPDGVTEVKAYPILIQSKDGQISVQGVANGTKVDVYTINGVEAGNGIATNGTATINTTMSSGEIAIVKIGEKSIKIVVR